MGAKRSIPPPLPTAALRVAKGGRARAEERIGSMLDGKWRLDELLGLGGMSVVYAATHRNGKRVAVKILKAELCNDSQLVSRFLREGYVANKLDHPASVSILDDGRAEDGEVYLVMDLVRGHSLDRYVKPRGPRLTVVRILRIFDDVLDLLAAAHASGIVHRDIKPANILITDTDVTKVLDFGIARLNEQSGVGGAGEGATENGTTMGTPAYMPPEQARGRWNQVDARSDLWSVGVTMFALLVGDKPRHADTVQEELLLAMTEAIPPLAMALPGVASPLARFIDTATAMAMETRFQDARTMQARLRELIGSAQIVPSAPAPRVDVALRVNTPSVPVNVQLEPRAIEEPPVLEAKRAGDTSPPSADVPSRTFSASTGTIPGPAERATRRPASRAKLGVVTGVAALVTAGVGISVWGLSTARPSSATRQAPPESAAGAPSVRSPAAVTSAESSLPPSAAVALPAAPLSAEVPVPGGELPHTSPPLATVETTPASTVPPPRRPEVRAHAAVASSRPPTASAQKVSPSPSTPPPSTTDVPVDTKANPLDERL